MLIYRVLFFSVVLISFIHINCSSSNSSRNEEVYQKIVEARDTIVNFEEKEEGDYPKGFGGLTIMKFDGNKVLATPSKGSYTFEIKNPFAKDFRLNIQMAGYTGKRDFVAVTLMSPKGDLSFWIRLDIVGIVGSKYEFGFYDTKIIGKKNHSIGKLSNVELKKLGDTYKLFLDNNFICSLQNNDFLQFTGVRISINSPDKFEHKPYLQGFCINGLSIQSL